MQIVRTRVKFAKIAALSAIFCASVVGGNISLRYLPVSFNQAVGATTSFFTVVFVHLMTMKQEGWLTYVTLIPVVTGVIIAIGVGVSGKNCSIPVGWNWKYNFQVKDQIGSFFYFPSLNFQRAAGGKSSRYLLADGDITLLISDWYTKSHKELRKGLEDGHDLGAPGVVIFDGLGPERPIRYEFLILKYIDLDIHVGKSYSFLVTMDQDASSDYYIIASPRFVNSSSGGGAVGVAALHYTDSQGPTLGPLPDHPSDIHPSYSMNQAKSIRLNLTASAALPNPQGSFKYGQITVTHVYVLVSRHAERIDGKWHATLNGLSYFTPSTPLTLAQLYKL
ncbi:Monocopper oxidase-like protein SKU5 [Bienertia sinuspersici]